MDEDDIKSIITLENFLKKTKDNKIQIKQPIKLQYKDIFSDEENDNNNTLDKKEKKNLNNKIILKSKKNHNNIKSKKYNIVKESIVFQELDAKKSIANISSIKNEFNNNSLYSSMLNNNKINFSENLIFNKKTEFIRKKSSINFDQLYELKLKNVRKVYF